MLCEKCATLLAENRRMRGALREIANMQDEHYDKCLWRVAEALKGDKE